MQGIALGWAGLGVALMLLAVVVGLRARQWWDEAQMPAGDVVYSDAGAWYPQREPLYSPRLLLVGRPDYLVEGHDGEIIPVEVKSSKAPESPYPGHVLQLAAYCALVEENYAVRPVYGIIQYKDRAFAVTYTDEMEADLLDVLDDMRDDLYAEDVDRDHEDWRRCAGCGHRNHCYQRLA